MTRNLLHANRYRQKQKGSYVDINTEDKDILTAIHPRHGQKGAENDKRCQRAPSTRLKRMECVHARVSSREDAQTQNAILKGNAILPKYSSTPQADAP